MMHYRHILISAPLNKFQWPTTRFCPASGSFHVGNTNPANKLEEFFKHIMSCRVVIEAPHKHHQGKQFNVRIDIGVPGNEIVVNRDHHEDVYVALRDAFDAVKRQLEDYARIGHGDIKTHKPKRSEERDNSILE